MELCETSSLHFGHKMLILKTNEYSLCRCSEVWIRDDKHRLSYVNAESQYWHSNEHTKISSYPDTVVSPHHLLMFSKTPRLLRIILNCRNLKCLKPEQVIGNAQALTPTVGVTNSATWVTPTRCHQYYDGDRMWTTWTIGLQFIVG